MPEKYAVSSEKQTYMNKTVDYHIGVSPGSIAEGFAFGGFTEVLLENEDETHFVFNMDNGRTIGFRDKNASSTLIWLLGTKQ